MKVFVAGATGAIGRQLVPRLVAAGHDVHGMTRRASKRTMLAEDMRHVQRGFVETNGLRTEGTDHLLSAFHSVGVERFVAQGIAGFGAYERTGGPVKSEEDPFDRRRCAR
jgi:uncharacterized protein YbjT (DUF2867 family)